jgi:hypothetical protein
LEGITFVAHAVGSAARRFESGNHTTAQQQQWLIVYLAPVVE